MKTVLMVGADVHDGSIVTKTAAGVEESRRNSWRNWSLGRKAMIAGLKKMASEKGAEQVVFVYEASGVGFGLHDELKEAGIECFVLAPTKVQRSVQEKRQKTDDKDAERALTALRSHLLAGAPLPKVWVPDPETRDDRELVRARLDVGKKLTTEKAQVRCLLKRNGIEKAEEAGKTWTRVFRKWLDSLTRGEKMGWGAQCALATLLRQIESLEKEEKSLDVLIEELSETPRHKEKVGELVGWSGVGLLVAIVFLTEMGDLKRFRNRRQVGAYLGLVPSSHESGESDDRKGHITRQGSPRLRKVLCQAAWARIRTNAKEREAYDRIVARNPKHRKIAVVAVMRRLGIRLWHAAMEAPTKTGA